MEDGVLKSPCLMRPPMLKNMLQVLATKVIVKNNGWWCLHYVYTNIIKRKDEKQS